LPDVLCLDADCESVWRYLEMAKSFSCARSTEESKRRTEMYRQQAARSKVSASSGNNEQALKKLGLWYTFTQVDMSQLDRVHELVSRTNQFNTTTKRYSKAQLVKFVNSDHSKIYVSNLGDSYGDLGLVAVVIVFIEEDLIEIDSFIMSCRAMGFGLENQVLFELCEKYKQEKVIKGLFSPTDRNSPCASFYANNGFVSKLDNEWVLPLGSTSLHPVQWLTKK
jgi:FkbH-like protein